jgi:hypothetical protein
LEELLELVRRHPDARLLVTTRSYALNPLCINLLHSFSRSIVDVPPLSDQELDRALEGSNLSEAQQSDPKLREALKTPFFLRLALAYLAHTGNLKNSGTEDIRAWLLRERIAPSEDFGSGLAERRRVAFDDICFRRTSKFSQFVDAPADAQAVAALLRDSVVAFDSEKERPILEDVVSSRRLRGLVALFPSRTGGPLGRVRLGGIVSSPRYPRGASSRIQNVAGRAVGRTRARSDVPV